MLPDMVTLEISLGVPCNTTVWPVILPWLFFLISLRLLDQRGENISNEELTNEDFSKKNAKE